jgi:hypothetical protein
VKLALSLLFTLVLAGSTASAADAAPSLPIQKALELAQQVLTASGDGDHVFITSVFFRKDAVFLPKSVWEVLWSRPINGSKPGKFEMGVEISMSGDVTHLIKGKLNVAPVNAH